MVPELLGRVFGLGRAPVNVFKAQRFSHEPAARQMEFIRHNYYAFGALQFSFGIAYVFKSVMGSFVQDQI